MLHTPEGTHHVPREAQTALAGAAYRQTAAEGHQPPHHTLTQSPRGGVGQPAGGRSPGRWRLRDLVRARLPMWVLLVVGALGMVQLRQGAQGESQDLALTRVVAERGIQAEPSDVLWLRSSGGTLGSRSALLVGRKGDGPRDIYHARVRTGGEGVILDLWSLTNITRSSGADERSLKRAGPHVLYTVHVGGVVDAAVVLDVRGEAESLTRSWPRWAKLQNAVTNLQDTGRSDGFGWTRFQLTPPARSLRVEAREERFVMAADGERFVIDPGDPDPRAERLDAQPQLKARPGTITWLVDRVRKVSWIGPRPIEWLEHTVFGLTDRAARAYHGLVPVDTEEAVRRELSFGRGLEEGDAEPTFLQESDPDLAWPPPPLEPVLAEPVRGEGRWMPVHDDPAVKSYPNAPPAFYQAFLRVDPERDFTRVYVTVWDPRQVQLHLVMGTREPESATGETGTGMIPRDPETMRRLVGAFNGGFQAVHGEFGMMAKERVYLPPKPWAATLAIYDDGRVGMGSWPAPPDEHSWDEETANRQIPDDIIAFRQNLTSVVEDGEYNPWGRWYWGAAPPWAGEQTFIERTGICLTEEGHLAYFWGESMGPKQLGKAMLQARCVRGMHLDMNTQHCGFEFYAAQELEKARTRGVQKEVDDARYRGPDPSSSKYWVDARKAVRSMDPMGFPRYLHRDPRDFFYLTLKPVLPGPDVTAPDGSRVSFDTSGLPHAGWPRAFARAAVGEGSVPSIAVRVDVQRAAPEPLTEAETGSGGPVLAYLTHAARRAQPEAQYGIRVVGDASNWRLVGPDAGGSGRVLIAGAPLGGHAEAGAAVGVDADGFLVYAERGGPGSAPLDEVMAAAGVEQAVALPPDIRLAFVADGETVSADGSRRMHVAVDQSLALVGVTRAPAEVMFPDNEPLPYSRWARLQDKRVRYLRDGEPRFRAPASGPEQSASE